MTKSIDPREYHKVNGTPCAYCGRIMDACSPHLMATRDHTTPKCMGGRHVVWCCYDCNRIKSDMTFDSWQEFMADYPGWWHGVPACIRNQYRPGWVPYDIGENGVHDTRKENCSCHSCMQKMTVLLLESKHGT